MKFSVPQEVKDVMATLEAADFKAFIVGGSVRDLMLGMTPKDWDVTTDAFPEEVQKLFPENVYENKFGTVGVKTGAKDKTLSIIEVTTFRKEESYSDFRHPDNVEFAKTVEDDLSRRDFTVNAIAMTGDGVVVDPYEGEKDLKKKVIKAVGKPEERFREDALRLMRAVRLAAELGFDIEEKTRAAIIADAKLLERIAKERVRDEFVKIISSEGSGAGRGVRMLEEFKLLPYVLPELQEGVGVAQNKHHKYELFEHNLRALEYAAEKGYPFDVRLASLMHDIGKSRTKEGEGEEATFYNHEIAGARMTREALDRLHFPRKSVQYISHLVRCHQFYYNVDEVSEAGVRRFLRKVGPENVEDILRVREADRIGSGVPKAVPYKNRHLQFMIEKVKSDPISPKMLKIDGEGVMKVLGIEPGPKVGYILAILLEEVLDDPKRNDLALLEARAKELGKSNEKELIAMAQAARKRKEEFEGEVESEIKKKYHVQ